MAPGAQRLRRLIVISQSLSKLISDQGLNPDAINSKVSEALSEDSYADDLTSQATITQCQVSKASFVTRKSGVIAGSLVAAAVLEQCGIKEYELLINDGQEVSANTVLIRLSGDTRAILKAERTALNFLSHLSGIATFTKLWVKEVSSSAAAIRDTRKTTPGLRELEKYAVRMGGGLNHRMSLSDQALIKDNHIAAAGSVSEAINRVKKAAPGALIEVEVDTLEQLKEALECSVEIVLLDNMSIEQTKAAVEIARGSNTKLESSGGLKLENVAAYAATGVNYLAVGALTHSAPVLDIGLDF
ncbi:MAG: carboxylating nicotinate-nucleotide diphosphorylase [Actinobacteria bacterium]|nr:carboxylating nicotinate-nucleotide diphosphorylase [Actinomycetota bacterium]NBQ00586.1 carboxylating nicotinate-nucleotide diphosphorylase [Actinomycetota bacterium]NBQ66333.1 carboxylating nicotinate-nucleotide diphosphorylase [Actinomycetota bacterium]NCU83635.1 carboxylating nicotinate-nucleotide diphosphorylase [Actinomycetota bacterium]NCZ72207.1 carboxylating nicotinate-nucleotide diphosphorylase [Actinomycetota bacterium]